MANPSMVSDMQVRDSHFTLTRTLFLTMALFAVAFLAACSSDGSSSSTSAPEEEVSRERNVSQVPWNKPENWEGGAVGGVNPGLGN